MSGKKVQRQAFTVPAPETRVPVEMWRELKSWLLLNDPDAPEMLRWSSEIASPPADAMQMAGEIIWIILCAGKTAQAARTIEAKVWKALWEEKPVVEAFGHKSRAAAITMVHNERDRLFAELQPILQNETRLLEWARQLPWVGQITAFQLMKNFGVDCPKPDIWLCRLAGIADKPAGHVEERFAACKALCQPLAAATEDRIAAVDSLLWLACNKGTLQVSNLGGPVTFDPRISRKRTMLTASEPQPDLFNLAT